MEYIARTAFISRDLSEGSSFRSVLERHGVAVSGQSLIHFEAVPFEALPEGDWLFFYSARAVHFCLEQLREALPTGQRIAAIGPGTAAALQARGLHCNFVGDGDPASTASAFLKVAAGARVIFPQARHSRQSVQRTLENAVTAVTLVVYDNQPLKDFPSSPAAVLVFTSPMNATAYLKRYSLVNGQRVVAIGRSTAAACQAFGIVPKTAQAPTEQALARAVLELLS